MSVILMASHDRPGEYLLLDAQSGAVIFGPFHSNPNSHIVESSVRRQLRGIEVRFVLVPRFEDTATRA